MATVYPLFKKRMGDAGTKVNFASGGDNFIVICCTAAGGAYNAAHEFVSSLSGELGRSTTIGSQDWAANGANYEFSLAASVQFTATGTGDIERIILAKNTGSDATSPLISNTTVTAEGVLTGQTITVTIPDPLITLS